MRGIIPVPAILLCVLFLSTPAFAAGRKSPTEAYLEQLHNQGKERVIVRFNNQPDKSTIARYNAKLIRELKIINALVCEIDKSKMESLKHQPNVKDVIPDAIIRIPEPIEIEAPPQIIAPLSYEGTVTIRWENLQAGLNSKAAWDNYGLDGSSIKIAFVDTGINYGADSNWPMPNLASNYLGGYDFVDDDNNPMPYIDPAPWPDNTEWHGTSIASNCVGEGVSRVVGTAYNAGYYALRALHGHDGTGLTSDVIAALEWCLDPDGNPATTSDRPDIINMSFGNYDEGPEKEELRIASDAVYNAGMILVAASGNDGYSYSSYPARFDNVISVGAHGEDQMLLDKWLDGKHYLSNGGVDVVAPGSKVYSTVPENDSGYWTYGTSGATACTSGLIALQLQYARLNNIQPNNGYIWELLKHSAVDMPLIPDLNYKGKGKVWAAGTDVNDANVGSIDLMASNWPIDSDFTFSDYAFIDGNYPVYQIGQDVNQTFTLTNLTDILGNTVETIENLKVTATQVYYGEPNEPNLPGNSVKVFPTITTLEPNEANSITLSYVYSIPAETAPGPKKTKLAFEFNFTGNSRAIKVAYNEPNSFWYAAIPGDINLNNKVDFIDYAQFALHWQQNDCHQPDWCGRADINRSGTVDCADLHIMADKWLEGL